MEIEEEMFTETQEERVKKCFIEMSAYAAKSENIRARSNEQG